MHNASDGAESMLSLVVFAPFFLVGYVVAHHWSIRVARALEAGGRMRGRGTTLVFAGPLAILSLVLASVVGPIFGVPKLGAEDFAWWQSIVTGSLMVVASWI